MALGSARPLWPPATEPTFNLASENWLAWLGWVWIVVQAIGWASVMRESGRVVKASDKWCHSVA